MDNVKRLEAITAAKSDAVGFYASQIDLPHGKVFANVVGNFQEGFLADRVTTDLDRAFEMAVEAAARLILAIIAKAENGVGA